MNINRTKAIQDTKGWLRVIPPTLKTMVHNACEFIMGVSLLTLSLHEGFKVLPNYLQGYKATGLAAAALVVLVMGVFMMFPFVKGVFLGVFFAKKGD